MVAEFDGEHEDRPDDLDAKRTFEEEQASGIGSTDSPKILGLSKYGTALTVYRRLTGETRSRPPSLPAWLGLKLENTVAELYSGATGNRVRTDARHHRHPKYPHVVCHLDRRVWGKPRTLVELKTRAYMRGWGKDGTAEVPAEVWVQTQHCMAVTSATETHVAVLFGHHTYHTYPIPRDDEFIGQLLVKLTEFWDTFVEQRVPPPPTGHPEDSADVRAHASAEGNGVLLPATPEIEMLVERLRLARQNRDQAKAGYDQLAHQLMLILDEYDGLTTSMGPIYYRRTKDSESVAWKLVASALRTRLESILARVAGYSDEIDVLVAEARVELEALPGLYTTIEPGQRAFRPYLRD